jgi:hypothetical protein
MALGTDVIGQSKVKFVQKEQDKVSIKAGLRKFMEAMAVDAKTVASRGSGLPKDWRSRVLR